MKQSVEKYKSKDGVLKEWSDLSHSEQARIFVQAWCEGFLNWMNTPDHPETEGNKDVEIKVKYKKV